MLQAIFLPLLISSIFKAIKTKRIFLTYIISATVTVLLPIVLLLAQTYLAVLEHGIPDTSAFAFGFEKMAGGIAITLFVTLFFQYIFNRTFGLTSKI